MRKMHFYAIEHTYGAGMRDETGDMIGYVEIFDSRRERDAWVAERDNINVNNGGTREALPASNRTIRRMLEYGYRVDANDELIEIEESN